MATELKNAIEVRRALLTYAPDLQKELTKEWAKTLKPVVTRARGFVPSESPMSGWAPRSFSEAKFPMYNAGTIRQGIVYQTTPSKPTSSGFVNLVRIKNKSNVGAIYETAGRKNGQGQEWVGPAAGGASKGVSRSTNRYAGNQFISNLGNLYGSKKNTGRLIYRAWNETQGRANATIIRALETTTAKFNRRTETVDLRRAA